MGPEDAKVMIVGEQPGDHEDLAGKPFVGPAGQLFDRTLVDAGIDRKKLYVTNAVKHFKYEARGKRRIHQRPDAGEVQQCRWWLNKEIELVRPKLIVAMGATALYALTGGKEKVSEVRGRPIPMQEGRTLFVTVHPSYLLRLSDSRQKEDEMLRFRKDIAFIR
jgi:DNA polymerase